MEGKNSKLSTLWIFATLNYLYCDVVTLMDPGLLKQFLAGNVGGMDVSQGFLLAAGSRECLLSSIGGPLTTSVGQRGFDNTRRP